jgi:hypothetical protein
MIRKDNFGVDFGIWKKLDPSILYIPLDLYSGNTARRLGLLTLMISYFLKYFLKKIFAFNTGK